MRPLHSVYDIYLGKLHERLHVARSVAQNFLVTRLHCMEK